VAHNHEVDYQPPRPAADAAAAQWIGPRLSARFGTVTRTVPAGFSAYARVLHPADSDSAAPLRWSAVAEANGRIMHALAQYERICVPAGDRMLPALPDVQAPAAGDLEPASLRSLCEVLSQHTGTGAECWFALWAGLGSTGGSLTVASFGQGPPALPEQAPAAWQLDPRAPQFSLPHRDYSLYAGPLRDAVRFGSWVTRDWFLPQSPSLIWPADRSWCVATETDFDSTLVGGTASLIGEILQRPDLEAWPVGPDDSLAFDGDTVNQP
jgi:hypothetical protein